LCVSEEEERENFNCGCQFNWEKGLRISSKELPPDVFPEAGRI
jgi:hypothetical protein